MSLIDCLVEASADVNVLDPRGNSLLRHVENVDMARILLKAGAKDIGKKDSYTALMYACFRGNLSMVELLLEYGFDVNEGTSENSPLTLAASRGRVDVMHALLNAGSPVDIDHQYLNEFAASHQAVIANSVSAVKLLFDHGANSRLLDIDDDVLLVQAQSREMARILIEAAPDTVNYRNCNGKTPIYNNFNNHVEEGTLQEIFDCSERLGVVVLVNIQDVDGDTPLHTAMMSANRFAVKLLLEKGAEVLVTGFEENTALTYVFQIWSLLQMISLMISMLIPTTAWRSSFSMCSLWSWMGLGCRSQVRVYQCCRHRVAKMVILMGMMELRLYWCLLRSADDYDASAFPSSSVSIISDKSFTARLLRTS
jgi:ankyrin repeat protein